ncbi:uncharacterized protein C8A04DRAFT_12629 [Dichotomopilus funicola]|uniref:BTB domain-containing protein n=1 Tax=Dichotomopilus funicola TaxID=1934379 RepID=A0AAN6V2C1_9PEZI|nr:hypothetical protein C8A04DRAFT_12629 [Dichotomopilus funicola]
MPGSQDQAKPRSRASSTGRQYRTADYMGDNDRTEELQTNSLYRALSGLLNSDKFSDMAIHCSGREFPAHRAIVCSQSSFFDKAMTSGFSEAASGIVNVPEDDPDILERFLQFLYTGTYKEDDVPGWGPPSEIQNLTPEEVDAFLATAPAGPAGTPALADREQNDADNVQDETGPPTSDAQSDTGSNFSDNSNFHRSASDESNHPAEEYAEFAPQEDHVQVLDGTGAEAEFPLNQREKELNTGEENALEGNLRFLQEIRIQQGFLSMRLYFMADKFDVPALKLLARDRFYRAAEFSWFDHPSFPAVVDELYTGTPPGDLALRETVCRLVGCNIHSQAQRSRLDEVMRKHGDFAVGVLNYFINWHHK